MAHSLAPTALFLAPILFICSLMAMPKMSRAQVIDFDRVSSPGVSISEKSYHRIERFLTHVFPTRQMRRFAHVASNARPTRLRRVTYEVITQEHINFVLAGYSVQWNEPVNELAIYRMEPNGPNQVWRSRPWEGNSVDLRFFAVPTPDRNVILFQEGGFQEGGAEGEFGLASVFTFKNALDGIFLHDLTPELPWLRARAHFPFRTLYGEQISMRVEPDGPQTLKNSDKNEVVLSASDEEYNLGMSRLVRPERSWKYNSVRNRFERIKAAPALSGPEATNNR
jgi:hypothetical protein